MQINMKHFSMFHFLKTVIHVQLNGRVSASLSDDAATLIRIERTQLVKLVYGGSGGSSLLSLLKLQVIHILMSFNTHVIPILYLFHVNLIFTLMSIAFPP